LICAGLFWFLPTFTSRRPRGLDDDNDESAAFDQGFTTLDAFLESEGVRDAFQAVAIKEVLAWQIKQAMEAQKLSQANSREVTAGNRDTNWIDKRLDGHALKLLWGLWTQAENAPHNVLPRR